MLCAHVRAGNPSLCVRTERPRLTGCVVAPLWSKICPAPHHPCTTSEWQLDHIALILGRGLHCAYWTLFMADAAIALMFVKRKRLMDMQDMRIGMGGQMPFNGRGDT